VAARLRTTQQTILNSTQAMALTSPPVASRRLA